MGCLSALSRRTAAPMAGKRGGSGAFGAAETAVALGHAAIVGAGVHDHAAALLAN
jgi:hypothetical protein